MQVQLPGVAPDGTVRVEGPKVSFNFEHRGQAFVGMRVSWDMGKPAIRHPLPSGGGGQPMPRDIAPGIYLVSLRVEASELPGLPLASIDSALSINGQLVATAKGQWSATDPSANLQGALFYLVVA